MSKTQRALERATRKCENLADYYAKNRHVWSAQKVAGLKRRYERAAITEQELQAQARRERMADGAIQHVDNAARLS